MSGVSVCKVVEGYNTRIQLVIFHNKSVQEILCVVQDILNRKSLITWWTIELIEDAFRRVGRNYQLFPPDTCGPGYKFIGVKVGYGVIVTMAFVDLWSA